MMKAVMMLLFTILLFAPINSFAECKIIHYADRDEAVCEGVPEPPPPPKIKRRFDSRSIDRITVIKSLMKLSARTQNGVAFNELSPLISEVQVDYRTYEPARGLSLDDAMLLDLINVAILKYQLSKSQINYILTEKFSPQHKKELIGEVLGYAIKDAEIAIAYYNENWQQ